MSPFLRALALGWAIWVSAGCASSGNTATYNSGSAGAAVTTAAVAAVAQVTTGCKFQGCPYGSYCNTKSGFCEARTCGEGCPGNTICNEGLDRCQAPPPPRTPNDFLPQDNRLDNFSPVGRPQ
jgi:hypothetical protein